MRRVFAAAARNLLLGCVGLLLGCAGSAPPATVYHRLEVAAPTRGAGPLLAGVVAVARPEASDVLHGRAMAVANAERESRIERSRYAFWADPPSVLVQQALAADLRAAGVAERVVVPRRGERPSHVVSGRLHRFERIVGGTDRVVVKLELALRDTAARQTRVDRIYEVEESASSGTTEAAVDAFARALATVFARFRADVSTSLASSP